MIGRACCVMLKRLYLLIREGRKRFMASWYRLSQCRNRGLPVPHASARSIDLAGAAR
ncbi:hypothetical protein [Agrobacterium tumefaciens]|uniref:hypothetical protein n=1 Tax=Agrobacterium tumefaciens TaxID=358 RepID=UPI0021D371D3|nr:hypothetical protein [Agrobacterium tumefaciens]UXS66710.1 hypothetical protein FY147_27780 [Agrobacterium tumefaciens]